jgi:hypothetical protein
MGFIFQWVRRNCNAEAYLATYAGLHARKQEYRILLCDDYWRPKGAPGRLPTLIYDVPLAQRYSVQTCTTPVMAKIS